MLKKIKGYAYTAAAYVVIAPMAIPVGIVMAIEWCFSERDWVFAYCDFAERLAVKGERLRS